LGLILHDCACLGQLEEGGMVTFIGWGCKSECKCMTKNIPSGDLVIRVHPFVPSKGLAWKKEHTHTHTHTHTHIWEHWLDRVWDNSEYCSIRKIQSRGSEPSKGNGFIFGVFGMGEYLLMLVWSVASLCAYILAKSLVSSSFICLIQALLISSVLILGLGGIVEKINAPNDTTQNYQRQTTEEKL